MSILMLSSIKAIGTWGEMDDAGDVTRRSEYDWRENVGACRVDWH
jgi:hypothetical protein